MFPSSDASACPLLPSRGSQPCRFPTFIGTMRGVRRLRFLPGRLAVSGTSSARCLFAPSGRRISAAPVAWSVGVGGDLPRKAGGRERGALPGSWRTPLKARPGLETPAAPGDLAYRSPRYCLPPIQRRRHPQRTMLSELNPHGSLPRCLRFTPRVAPRGARLAIGLPATALAGSDFHRLGSYERFHPLMSVSSFPRFILAR